MVAACAVIGVLAGAPVAAAAQVIHATEGEQYQGPVLFGCPTTASPTIDWGDGARTAGSVGGGGSVNGRHTYAEGGRYSGTVTGCGSGPEQFTAEVADAPLTGVAKLIVTEAGQFVTNAIVGFFQDANSNAPWSDFRGTITFTFASGGYQVSVTASVVPMGAGLFAVYGSAPVPYDSAGLFPVSIYIQDAGGSNVHINSVVEVEPRPPGPPGPTGAPGASGKAAKFELIRCTTLTKKVKRRVRRLTKCTTGRVVSGTGKLRVADAIPHATVSRGRRVYATGASVPLGHKRTELVLNDLRPLHRGRYTLTVRARHNGRSVTTRRKITIT